MLSGSICMWHVTGRCIQVKLKPELLWMQGEAKSKEFIRMCVISVARTIKNNAVQASIQANVGLQCSEAFSGDHTVCR